MYQITTPNITEIETSVSHYVTEATALQIQNQQDWTYATSWMQGLKEKRNHVVSLFKDSKESAFSAHKAICALEKRALDPLQQAGQIIERKATEYRQRAEREMAEEARRREVEAAKQAEALRRAQEEAKLAEAIQLEKEGFGKVAAEVFEEPIETPVIVPEAVVEPTFEGAHLRKTYSAKVTDMMALVKAVAAGQAPIEVLDINQSAINKLASAMKFQLRLPGVQVVENVKTITRG